MNLLESLSVIRERINKELRNELKNKGINLSCSHLLLLSLVYSNDGQIEIKGLVKRLEKKKSTVSEMINSLERNGYLVKYQSKEDKRIYYVKTTDKVEEMKDYIEIIMDKLEKKIFTSFTEKDLDLFNELIQKIIINLD